VSRAQLTRHSRQRAEERLGLRADSFQRLAQRALDSGLTHAQTTGPLKRYLSKIYLDGGHRANNLRIYGHHIYLFGDNGDTTASVLLTVVPLPNEFKKIVAKLSLATTARASSTQHPAAIVADTPKQGRASRALGPETFCPTCGAPKPSDDHREICGVNHQHSTDQL
jgi:hypothetical protein